MTEEQIPNEKALVIKDGQLYEGTPRSEVGYWPDENEAGGPFDPNHASVGAAIRPIWDNPEKTLVANGYAHNQVEASKHLKDQVYHISKIDIGSFISYIEVEELPGIVFNSLHFKFAHKS